MWRGGEGEERKFPSFLVFLQHPLPYPLPAVSLAPFLARSLTLVRGSRAFTFSELTVTGTQRPLDNLFGPLISALSAILFNLVPRVFSLSNMAAAGEKTLAHSELKRSLIGAFHCAFIRALSLVYSSQHKDGYPLRAD